MPRIERAEVVVLGAGAAGLAAGATLKRHGIEPVILERDERIGGSWSRRYDRLHLHTARALSGLPYRPLPRGLPRYVTKDDYARYLADYARQLRLPVLFERNVERIRPLSDATGWLLETKTGDWETRAVVVATGKHAIPHLPRWPGAERFGGTLLHSAGYRRAEQFAGMRVLVVGLGNSGAEIAADLAESGAARVAVAVRTPPPITSREILGLPVQLLGILLAPLPPQLVDRLGRVLRRLANGDLTAHGLGREAWGPFTARRPPVIDVGFMAQVRARRIEVFPGLDRLTHRGAVFADGRTADFDVVVAATGFTAGLERLVEARGEGLYFIGFNETPRGALFEANRDARKLARRVSRWLDPRRSRRPRLAPWRAGASWRRS